MRLQYKPLIAGRVSLFTEDTRSGRRAVIAQSNSVVDSSILVIAGLLGGKYTTGLNCVYVRFADDDEQTNPAVSTSDTLTYFNDLDSDNDYLRLAVAPPVVVNAEVTITAYASSLVGQLGHKTFVANSSYIYSSGLVCSPNSNDFTQDILFARTAYDPAIQLQSVGANTTFGVQWILTVAAGT